jgi:hypothetical protein
MHWVCMCASPVAAGVGYAGGGNRVVHTSIDERKTTI